MQNSNKLTIGDLFIYCKKQARIEIANYGSRSGSGYHGDCERRYGQMTKCKRQFGHMVNRELELTADLSVGRFTVTADGTIDYTAGQYPATEIWAACHDWLKVWNVL